MERKDTYRSRNGAARLSFHPEWDKECPWVGYINGTAGRHYHSLEMGMRDMASRGYPFDTKQIQFGEEA